MELKTEKKARAGANGVLREEVTQAIREAAIEEICQNGLGRLSVDAVARRARVGKAAIYRRWPNKEEMLKAALLESGLKIAGAPDTGSLESDIAYYLESAAAILTDPIQMRLLPHLYAELATKSPLGESIREALHNTKRENVTEITQRAIARGELPKNFDQDFALSLLAGPIYWHLMIMQNDIDSAYLDQLHHAIMASLKALY